MNEVNEEVMALGTHLVRVNGDRVYVTVRGQLTANDMQGLYHLNERIRQTHTCVFAFYDGRLGTGIDPAARKSGPRGKYVVAELRVVYGISFAVRVILNMLLRTQKVLLGRDMHVHIFEEERAATDFFEAECIRIRNERAR